MLPTALLLPVHRQHVTWPERRRRRRTVWRLPAVPNQCGCTGACRPSRCAGAAPGCNLLLRCARRLRLSARQQPAPPPGRRRNRGCQRVRRLSAGVCGGPARKLYREPDRVPCLADVPPTWEEILRQGSAREFVERFMWNWTCMPTCRRTSSPSRYRQHDVLPRSALARSSIAGWLSSWPRCRGRQGQRGTGSAPCRS